MCSWAPLSLSAGGWGTGPRTPYRSDGRQLARRKATDRDGNAVVNGDANAGKGCTTLTGGAVVTGNKSPRSKPLEVDTARWHGAMKHTAVFESNDPRRPYLRFTVRAEVESRPLRIFQDDLQDASRRPTPRVN